MDVLALAALVLAVLNTVLLAWLSRRHAKCSACGLSCDSGSADSGEGRSRPQPVSEVTPPVLRWARELVQPRPDL